MLNKLLSTQLNRNILGLFTSNIIAFLVTGLSYIVYSKALKPDEFGIYSVALAIGNFGTLVLDGGLKNTIIKSPNKLSKVEEGTLLFLMIGSSILAIGALFFAKQILTIYYPSIISDYNFLALFSGVFWLSYPWIAIPTASLERSLDYSGIAWIESIGIVLERACPALLILTFNGGIYSFVWSLLASRLFRVMFMNKLYKPTIHMPTWKQVKSTSHLLSEGAWLQLAVGASLVRDNLHTILVGIMFGKTWVGFYAWALQLSAISSQVFVQIVARVSIPMFARAKNFEDRWTSCVHQIKMLTIVITPVLGIVLTIIPTVNEHFFQEKWTSAIAILPLLFLRMLPGLATTPIASVLMVQSGGRSLASATVIWTVLEVIAATVFLKIIGPMGLAWSYSLIVWLGLYIYILFLNYSSSTKLILDVSKALFKRSSLFISITLTVFVSLYGQKAGINLNNVYQCLLIVVSIIIFSYISEREIRKFWT